MPKIEPPVATMIPSGNRVHFEVIIPERSLLIQFSESMLKACMSEAALNRTVGMIASEVRSFIEQEQIKVGLIKVPNAPDSV